MTSKKAAEKAGETRRSPTPPRVVPARSAAEVVQRLQSLAGNRAVTAMLKSGPTILDDEGRPAPPVAAGTGLPGPLRAGIETLSGLAMDDVRVHYGSPEPARYHALAFARGTTIHVAPGQEKHLPHEAWHTVQQKQGRVTTGSDFLGARVNDDPALEREADLMGNKALQLSAGGDPSALQRRLAPPTGIFQPVWDTAETSDVNSEDHGEGFAEERLIDWGEITSQGLARLPQAVLYQIFLNLVDHHYAKAGASLPDARQFWDPYLEWRSQGVFTRARFKTLIGLGETVSNTDETARIIQPARAGNTYSVNGNYDGKNGQPYQNVVYRRDAGGNIDFSIDPKITVSSFNATENPKIDPNAIAWHQPLDASTWVQMSQDLANPREGIMHSGKKVDLPKASRAQHFAIADMLMPNNRSGTWTWHHLNAPYTMILVDMAVHAKHGHNGGVHLWK